MDEEIDLKNGQILQELMQQAGIANLKELSERSQVSERQLFRLVYGLLAKMSIDILLKLSRTLQVSPQKLLDLFLPEDIGFRGGEIEKEEEKQQESIALKALKQEYQLLQQQMEQQKQTLLEEFQQSSLQLLESWLVQWPTARAVASKNPQLPAVRFLDLVKPVEKLIRRWGVEPIGEVGEEVSYNPMFHQLIEGSVQASHLVQIRYIGYRQGEKLLHRAKVSPVANSPSLQD
jgi:DNA-binding Xre family transcriptional regulator